MTQSTPKPLPFWRLGLFLAVLASPLSAKTITASGGTPGAVQTAIDSASNGDTVMIPAGTFSWNTGVTVKKPIKLYGFGLTTVLKATGNAALVTLIPSNAGSVELGKLKFVRNIGTPGPYLYAGDAVGKPMLVHSIAFENTGFGPRAVEWGTNGGVIYNCTFVSTDKSDNNAIAFKNPGSDSAWHEVDCMGMADANGDKNTYLEDCTFKDIFLQALDFDDNSRTVMRHCVFDNSAVGSHGQETSAVGARQWELYDNEFIFTGGSNNPGPQDYPLNMNYWLFIRGGGPGVCFNNKMPDINSSAWGNKTEVKFNLYNIRRKGQVPCQQLPPPAAHQIGYGSDANGKLVLSPVYFWGNTGGGNYDNPSLENYQPDECGSGLSTSQFVRKNIEFYVDTEKPGYKPYTYPHPLRAGDTGGTPQPEPTVTPNPTPAPTATPEPPRPTPTPTQTWEKWIEDLDNYIRAHPPYPDQR